MASKKTGIQSFKTLSPNNQVDSLLAYIESELSEFSVSDTLKTITNIKKNENQHSTAFCKYMTTSCQARYYFLNESSQKGSSKVDIGVYVGDILIFTIEAKVLPTPEDKKRDAHEYVYGQGAGIQRFKEGKHGLDDWNQVLSQSGMLAYIKEYDFDYWYSKVNEWVLEASWPDNEKLEKTYFNTTAKLISKHIRSDKSKVILYHFWIKV